MPCESIVIFFIGWTDNQCSKMPYLLRLEFLDSCLQLIVAVSAPTTGIIVSFCCSFKCSRPVRLELTAYSTSYCSSKLRELGYADLRLLQADGPRRTVLDVQKFSSCVTS